jgi:hypothetical protein
MRLQLNKLLSVLPAVCLAAAFTPVTAQAESDGLWYCGAEDEFRYAVANAGNGDTIVITDNIGFTEQGMYIADSQLQIINPNPFILPFAQRIALWRSIITA